MERISESIQPEICIEAVRTQGSLAWYLTERYTMTAYLRGMNFLRAASGEKAFAYGSSTTDTPGPGALLLLILDTIDRASDLLAWGLCSDSTSGGGVEFALRSLAGGKTRSLNALKREV
jgi:hypothetical protein